MAVYTAEQQRRVYPLTQKSKKFSRRLVITLSVPPKSVLWVPTGFVVADFVSTLLKTRTLRDPAAADFVSRTWFSVVLADESPSLAFFSSSSDSGGDAKRAVGRGPAAEGPLGFLRIG